MGAYRKRHAHEEMLGVCSRRCIHNSCTEGPRFNVEGSKKAAYCKQHAEDRMLDVVRKHCSHYSCTWRASLGLEGNKADLF